MSDVPYTFGGLPLLWAKPCLSYIGAWHAELEASFDGKDPKPNADGTYTLSANDVDFVGTPVLGPRKLVGRVKVKIVGGRGGLKKKLDPKHYSKPAVLTVVRDILADCGEVLSSGVDPATLDGQIQSWQRGDIPAGRCLTLVLDQLGLIWRVLRDGTIWIGKEEYPASSAKFELIDEDWSAGVIEIASDAPDLEPGVTLLDQQIRYVVHDIQSGSLRTSAYLQTPSGLMDQFLAGVRQEIAYTRLYPSTVVAQNADLTLQLLPDDARMRGTGLDNVRIRHGLPGFEVHVREGARVSLGFDGGNPSMPYASLWETNGNAVDYVEFVKNSTHSPFVRVGDELEAVLPMGLPLTTSLGPAIVTVVTPLKAVLTGPGNSGLRG
ncbi:MAG: hypothetical protein ABFD89_17720 [Bryobacteraceae bacterium]